MNSDKRLKVYKLLKKIPRGRVSTYGALASRLGMNPRLVGRILGQNSHPEIYPCYRVVRSDGSLGGYTIDSVNNEHSLSVKKKRLLRDGVKFSGERVEKKLIMKTI